MHNHDPLLLGEAERHIEKLLAADAEVDATRKRNTRAKGDGDQPDPIHSGEVVPARPKYESLSVLDGMEKLDRELYVRVAQTAIFSDQLDTLLTYIRLSGLEQLSHNQLDRIRQLGRLVDALLTHPAVGPMERLAIERHWMNYIRRADAVLEARAVRARGAW